MYMALTILYEHRTNGHFNLITSHQFRFQWDVYLRLEWTTKKRPQGMVLVFTEFRSLPFLNTLWNNN